MSIFGNGEDDVRRVRINAPPGGYMSPRKVSPVPPSNPAAIVQQRQDSANQQQLQAWSNVAGVNDNQDKFQVSLDMGNFNTQDLSVKSVGNRLIIEGKQVEREPTTRAYVAREFNLNYILPQDVAVAEMRSSLSEMGVLTVEAPKIPSPRPSPSRRKAN